MQKHLVLSKAVKLGAVGVMMLTAISPAFAVASGSGNSPQATLTPARQQYRQQICDATQATVQTRTQAREQIMNQFTQRYENFNTKLNNLKTTVTEKFPDIDLTNLNADITKLQAMYNTAVQASTQAYVAFGQLNFDNCLNGSGDFKGQLTQARLQTKNAYEAHKAYWTFIRESVRPDLEAIRTQIQDTTVV